MYIYCILVTIRCCLYMKRDATLLHEVRIEVIRLIL